MTDTIYCIANQKTMECYCGRTYQAVGERWSQHIWGAWKGKAESKLAEAIRHAPEDFEFLVLEQSQTASEAHWMQQLKSEGWTLLNETGGNRRKPRQRDTAKERAWRDANAAANTALNAKEAGTAAESAYRPKATGPAWDETPEYVAKAEALHAEWLAQQARWAELRAQARQCRHQESDTPPPYSHQAP